MGMLFNSFSSFITLASNITCSLNKTEQSQSESSSNYQMMGLSQGGMFGSGNQNCASICGGQGGYPQPPMVPQVQPMVCNCSPGGAGPFPFIPGAVNPFGPNVNPYNPLQPVGPNYTTSVVKPEPSTSCSYALYSQCETVLPDEKTITQSVPSVLPPNVQPTIPVGPYGGFGGSSVCISSCALPQVLPKPVIVNPYLPNHHKTARSHSCQIMVFQTEELAQGLLSSQDPSNRTVSVTSHKEQPPTQTDLEV